MNNLGNKEIFSSNLKFYMEKHNKTRHDICKDLNFKYTTFSDWYNGKKYPRIDKIEMLANYFHIQKADLIESREKKAPKKAVERNIESDLEDMMNSIAIASYEDGGELEDVEAFKAAVKFAIMQAKRLEKKDYTPKTDEPEDKNERQSRG